MIRKELIKVDVDIKDRLEVIKAMVNCACDKGIITDPNQFYESVIHREIEIPTSIGYLVAIPHGKSESVNEVFVSYFKTKEPFIWDERNNEPVNTIFMMGLPYQNGERDHLLFLSRISKKLMNSEFREALQKSTTVEETYELLNSVNQ